MLLTYVLLLMYLDYNYRPFPSSLSLSQILEAIKNSFSWLCHKQVANIYFVLTIIIERSVSIVIHSSGVRVCVSETTKLQK